MDPTKHQSLYEVLAVETSSSDRQISSAYKQLCLKYHPDRNFGNEEASIKLTSIEAAYKILGNPSEKEAYDALHGYNQPSIRSSNATNITATSIIDMKLPEDTSSSTATTSLDASESAPQAQSSGGGGGGGITAMLKGVMQRGQEVGSSILERGKGIVVNATANSTSSNSPNSSSPQKLKSNEEIMIETAKNICEGNWMEGGGSPLDARVEDLPFGWASEKSLDSRSNKMFFYRLTVDPSSAQNGFALLCSSFSMLLYKVTIFNKTGDTILFSKSSKRSLNSSSSSAALFFTKFPVYDLRSSINFNANMRNQDSTAAEALSHLLIVDGFESTKMEIAAGHYLVCVSFEEEGNGVMQKALELVGNIAYKLIAVQFKADLAEIKEVNDTDNAILECKGNLSVLVSEYETAKAQYDAICKRLKEEADQIDALIQSREIAYRGLLEASITAYSPVDQDSESSSGIQPSKKSMFPSSSSSIPMSISQMPDASSVARSSFDTLSDLGSGLSNQLKSAGSSVLTSVSNFRTARSNSQSSTESTAANSSEPSSTGASAATPSGSIDGGVDSNSSSSSSSSSLADSVAAPLGWIGRRLSLAKQTFLDKTQGLSTTGGTNIISPQESNPTTSTATANTTANGSSDGSGITSQTDSDAVEPDKKE